MEKKPTAAITHFPNPIHLDAVKKPAEEKIQLIEQKMREIMEILGVDLSDESLNKTPLRVAKMYVNEIFSGLDPAHFPSITLYAQKIQQDELVFVKNISFISFCEHHLVPILGTAFVAYLPRDKIIGLSKVNRIVHYFAKRPQVQERLTAQIADSLSLLLETEDIAVAIIATHYCVVARGVEDIKSETETHVLRGQFHSVPHRRSEFFSCLHMAQKEKQVQ